MMVEECGNARHDEAVHERSPDHRPWIPNHSAKVLKGCLNRDPMDLLGMHELRSFESRLQDPEDRRHAEQDDGD
jgi:hypothetical protein